MSPTARVSCCLHPLLTPSPLQAEVQRVQLQQAVHKMEMALEDPVKGGEVGGLSGSMIRLEVEYFPRM